MLGAVRPSLAIWYLHEMFHHKVESFAIRLEIVERVPRYCHYRKVVYNPRRDQQSDDLLEEALATAESCLRLEEPTCRRAIPADVMERTCAWLVPWVPALPPGYRTAGEYLYDTGFSTTSSAARRTMVKIAASCPALQPQTSSLCRGGGLPGGGVSIFPNRGRVRQVFADNNTMRRPASGAPAVQAARRPAALHRRCATP